MALTATLQQIELGSIFHVSP